MTHSECFGGDGGKYVTPRHPEMIDTGFRPTEATDATFADLQNLATEISREGEEARSHGDPLVRIAQYISTGSAAAGAEVNVEAASTDPPESE